MNRLTQIAWLVLCVLLSQSSALAADISADYTQGPGGYYRKSDRSGPYSLNQDGTATLIGVPVPLNVRTMPFQRLHVDIIHGWSGDQMIGGGVTAQTLSSATVLVKRSRGALLLSAGPFETAPSTALTIRIICN